MATTTNSSTETPLAISNLFECFDSFDALISDFDDSQWAAQSLCPKWKMRDVLIHNASIEALLIGKTPAELVERVPFEKMADFEAEAASMSNGQLVQRYREVLAQRREELANMDEAYLAQPSALPVGKGTYRDFMQIRVFDLWVHEQDVRQPLGILGHESGPAAEMAFDQIEAAMAYVVGKKIGLKEHSIAMHLSGPIKRSFYLETNGRAKPVDYIENPDVVLNADSTTFALLCCGRIDPQISIDSGAISWSGVQDLGEKAARNLAFTF